jgi:hypothetical protein
MAKSKYSVAQNCQYGTFLVEVGRGVDPVVASRHLRDFSDAETKKIVDGVDGGVVVASSRFEV